MGKVIGPLHLSPKERLIDWVTMRELRESLKYYKAKDPTRYDLAIKKESSYLQGELTKYARAA